MTCKRSVQFAQQIGEIPIAGLIRRSFKCPAQRRGNAGMRRRNLNTDHAPVQAIHIGRHNILTFQFHWNANDWRTAEVSRRIHLSDE